MSKHHFAPMAPKQPCATVPLADLTRALVSKEVGQIWSGTFPERERHPWNKNKFVQVGERDPDIKKSIEHCQSQILNDLRADALTAYIYSGDSAFPFRRILSGYWQSKLTCKSVCGTLVPYNRPHGLLDDTIYVFHEEAERWLKQHQIDKDSLYFPTILRKTEPKKSADRKPDLYRTWFVETALEILKKRSGLSPEFRQADLIRAVFACHPAKWGDEERSESTMKRYAAQAERRYDDWRND